MRGDILRDVVAARRNRDAIAVITNIATGNQRLVTRAEAASDLLLDKAFRFDKSGVEQTADGALKLAPLLACCH